MVKAIPTAITIINAVDFEPAVRDSGVIFIIVDVKNFSERHESTTFQQGLQIAILCGYPQAEMFKGTVAS
ncbi:MAG TPA: hypothetical protein DIW81_25105 [Planctomycetaceae bacterium]|nr:hypothetical protein [Rubinisphaera sp.]HCS54825.1 hypothetical protein [Planctomycetaceae bacterium]